MWAGCGPTNLNRQRPVTWGEEPSGNFLQSGLEAVGFDTNPSGMASTHTVRRHNRGVLLNRVLDGELTMSTKHIALPCQIGNLRQYTQLVESFPCLEEKEEQALAERLRDQNDLEAARNLITSHLRYVVYIARGYRGYGLPQEDLLQEGNIGLMKAVRRFDPGRGVRLAAYASYWIRAQIHDFILKNWRIVKVVTTKAKRKLFYNLRSAKQRLEWLNREEADEIAEALDVSADDVIVMEGQMYLKDLAFDGPGDLSDDEPYSPSMYLQDNAVTPDTEIIENNFMIQASDTLHDALATLDERSRDIIESRWLVDDDEDKPTLQALGERYQISAERVRQLEVAAIKRLREFMVPKLGVDHCDVGVPADRNLIAI